jgi:hypothetical protein
MADYIAELSQASGLPAYPKQGPFGDKNGSVIGVRDGYLVVAGQSKDSRGHKLARIMVRFAKAPDPSVIKSAVAQNKSKPSKVGLEVGPDFLSMTWRFSFGSPKVAEFSDLIATTLQSIKPVAPPLDGRCEKCQSSSKQEIVLQNGVPSYLCYDCQQRIGQEANRAAEDYESRSSNFPKGLLFGVVAAFAGSLAWGGVAFALERIFLYGAIGIGYFIAWMVSRGMGKITRGGQVLVGALTLVSVLFGDAFFFSLVGAKAAGVAWSPNVLLAMVINLWQIETQGDNFLSTVFALIGAAAAMYRMRKPKFAVRFERLGHPST